MVYTQCWLVEDQLLWNILGIFQGEDRLKERGLEWECGVGVGRGPSQKVMTCAWHLGIGPTANSSAQSVLCYIVVVIAATIF